MQDIPSAVTSDAESFRARPKDAVAHSIDVRPSQPARARCCRRARLRSSCAVNSRHHQSVARGRRPSLSSRPSPPTASSRRSSGPSRLLSRRAMAPRELLADRRVRSLFDAFVDASEATRAAPPIAFDQRSEHDQRFDVRRVRKEIERTDRFDARSRRRAACARRAPASADRRRHKPSAGAVTDDRVTRLLRQTGPRRIDDHGSGPEDRGWPRESLDAGDVRAQPANGRALRFRSWPAVRSPSTAVISAGVAGGRERHREQPDAGVKIQRRCRSCGTASSTVVTSADSR